MQVYLVGGAVRDQLLGRPVTDRDFLVVGSSPEEMLAHGYRQVGRDFPVFLHPDTHEEYALARRERKQGSGHHGFVCDFGPEVSLEEDLLRRDLTINAIAIDGQGQVIDPWQGQRDLQHRWLRPVSNAFAEDPLRLLRLARFRAQLADHDFQVHPEAMAAMRAIQHSHELLKLSWERIGQECLKAMNSHHPWLFWQTLADSQALLQLWPDACLPAHPWLLPNWLNLSLIQRLVWQLSLLHQTLTAPELLALSKRWRLDNKSQQLLLDVHCHQHTLLSYPQLTGDERWQLLSSLDSERQPERLALLIPLLVLPAQTHELIAQDTDQLLRVTPQPLIAQGLSGKALGNALKQAKRLSLQSP